MKKLFALNRTFSGRGINHEKQSFNSTMTFTPLVQNEEVSIHFKAVGDDGTVFHEETSVVKNDESGQPTLYVSSTNHDGITPHTLKKVDATPDGERYVFAFGDINDRDSFREEIILDLWTNGTVGYTYYWGLPGGDFAQRSGTKMLPI